MPQSWVILMVAVGLLLTPFAVFGSRFLLGWYLYEVRRIKIPEAPGEAIITYPLA